MSDPLQPIKDEVTAIETSVANLLSRLTTLAKTATAAGVQVDPAEITALVSEMQQNIQAKIDGAAPLPAA